MQILFKKLEYSFLVKFIKTENATFPFKTAFSQASIKTNRVGVQNGSITKNGILLVTALFFGKFCFSLRTSYKELI